MEEVVFDGPLRLSNQTRPIRKIYSGRGPLLSIRLAASHRLWHSRMQGWRESSQPATSISSDGVHTIKPRKPRQLDAWPVREEGKTYIIYRDVSDSFHSGLSRWLVVIACMIPCRGVEQWILAGFRYREFSGFVGTLTAAPVSLQTEASQSRASTLIQGTCHRRFSGFCFAWRLRERGSVEEGGEVGVEDSRNTATALKGFEKFWSDISPPGV